MIENPGKFEEPKCHWS